MPTYIIPLDYQFVQHLKSLYKTIPFDPVAANEFMKRVIESKYPDNNVLKLAYVENQKKNMDYEVLAELHVELEPLSPDQIFADRLNFFIDNLMTRK